MIKTVKKIKAGDVLIIEGEESYSMFFVRAGKLEAFKDVKGVETKLGDINEKEMVGEMSFFEKTPRAATVKAVTDCELVEFPYEQFHKMLEALPDWNVGLINCLIDRLRQVEEKLNV
ncbi:cyclic nucleotide-binding domain-containing protein [Bacteriovoracaceae bacterium]|nr:cyclic nucleotide-binding domain-containing protein [Bacteriovoracaceae bacterium]